MAMGMLSSTLPSYNDANFMFFYQQCFIPNTNFNTSGMQAGRLSGLPWLNTSCVSCMTSHMLCETVAQGVNAGDEVSFMSPCPSFFY